MKLTLLPIFAAFVAAGNKTLTSFQVVAEGNKNLTTSGVVPAGNRTQVVAAGNETLTPFEVVANAPGTPVHNLRLAASNLFFSLGGQTTTFCPLEQGCPPTNHTVIDASGSALDVAVPGGQRIFVNPAGALSFTQAHSNFIPPGSSLGPFFQRDRVWHFTGEGARDFMACPAANRTWQVFAALRNATVPMGNVSACAPFVAIVIPWLPANGTPGAWQYV